jgi:hypothetical protein
VAPNNRVERLRQDYHDRHDVVPSARTRALLQLVATGYDFTVDASGRCVERDFVDLVAIPNLRSCLRRVSLEIGRRVETTHRRMKNFVFTTFRIRAAKVPPISMVGISALSRKTTEETVGFKELGDHSGDL